MVGVAVREIEFRAGDVSTVAEAMDELKSKGKGWVNIGPGLTEEQIAGLPRPSSLGQWFSGRGPAIPMGTWTPSKKRPAMLGLEHGTGPKALDRLKGAGILLPAESRKVQDHAKTGIVLEVGDGVSSAELVTWVLTAGKALCPIEIDDHWVAQVHTP